MFALLSKYAYPTIPIVSSLAIEFLLFRVGFVKIGELIYRMINSV